MMMMMMMLFSFAFCFQLVGRRENGLFRRPTVVSKYYIPCVCPPCWYGSLLMMMVI